MKPGNDDPPYQVRYEDAWDVIDDDDHAPEHQGEKFYELPSGHKVYEGDDFWFDLERYTVTLVDVVEKIRYHRSVSTEKSMGAYATFEPNWRPPSPPHERGHSDEKWTITVDEFDRLIQDDGLVPHRANGLPPLPP